MSLYMDTFCKENGKWIFDHYHSNFLQAELCTDEELPEEQKSLLLLRDVYIGEMSIGRLLFWYSKYEERACEAFSDWRDKWGSNIIDFVQMIILCQGL